MHAKRIAAARRRTGMKFFPLKCYLPKAAAAEYLYSADYKGINDEQLDFSDRATPHSRGRSSRAHAETRLPHEGTAQTENKYCGFATAHCPTTFFAIVRQRHWHCAILITMYFVFSKAHR